MRTLWIVAIAASAGAGVIHLALGPEHVEELGGLGLGFYLAAGLQLGWALAVAVIVAARAAGRGSVGTFLRSLALTGIAINAALIGAWLFSRVVGLPAGDEPWVPESIGRPDGVSVILQLALVVGLAAWLRLGGMPRSASLRHPILATALAVVLIGTGTAFGLTGEAHGHGADAAMDGAHSHDADMAAPELEIHADHEADEVSHTH